ncbi:MAG: glycoside hydrolase family 5 protein [Chitinispirillales bacterium]|jgi:aryl-phospho-beta-D-glucosidase BglC (GH1 family)|nr:glycoside hydrolase family 5 protein [Chitinispirillales bacterium]
MKRSIKVLFFAAAFAASAFSQVDTARVPVIVTNTNALVKIVPAAGGNGFGDSASVTANQQHTLILRSPDGGFTSISHSAQKQPNAPALVKLGRGNTALSLHAQTFGNAAVELFSVNGKRILHGKASASKAGETNISRRNVARGVYILSVKGTDSNSFKSKLTHDGGKLNIKVAFGGAAENRLAKQSDALSGGWTLTASSEGYVEKSLTLNPQKGDNPVQTITLLPVVTSAKSALQYFRDENIKVGWNLGNTLDAVNTATNVAVEGAWGTPAATKALIDAVAGQGVDIVRIGCSWNGHIGDAPNYTVSAARLTRVKEVVDWVLGAGMKAVINIHHDGNYTSPPNTWGFLKFAEVRRGEADNNQVKDQLGKVWTQIANHFKSYGDNLIFETMNEVHSGNWGSGSGDAYQAEQDLLFEWNQTALSAIRATGGNNAKRYVAVPALGSTEPAYVISAHNRQKLLPNDPGNGTDKLIVSVHFYAPWQYTVANITCQGNNCDIKHTLTQAELNNIATQAGNIKTNFIDKGIAAYYGEWGAQTNGRRNMDQTIRDTHVDYIRRVAAAAAANGIVPIIWDDGGNFKILERSGGSIGKPNTPFATLVWNAYIEAAGGSGGIVIPPPGEPVPPANITGNLGNYAFGSQENGIDPNYTQALWELSAANAALAKAPGTKLVLRLSKAPAGAAQFVWQGRTSEIWWQDNDILGETGSPIKSGVTWNADTNTLTLNLSQALADYARFTAQPDLNLIFAYYGGESINDMGITSANLE